MAIRKCPYCLTVAPAGEVVAYSNDLVCAGCRRPLEISPLSRNLAVAAGLAAGAAIYSLASKPAAGGMLGWVLPLVYGFLALSAVAPLVLMLSADLRLKSAEAPPAATHEQHPASHGAGALH